MKRYVIVAIVGAITAVIIWQSETPPTPPDRPVAPAVDAPEDTSPNRRWTPPATASSSAGSPRASAPAGLGASAPPRPAGPASAPVSGPGPAAVARPAVPAPLTIHSPLTASGDSGFTTGSGTAPRPGPATASVGPPELSAAEYFGRIIAQNERDILTYQKQQQQAGMECSVIQKQRVILRDRLAGPNESSRVHSLTRDQLARLDASYDAKQLTIQRCEELISRCRLNITKTRERMAEHERSQASRQTKK